MHDRRAFLANTALLLGACFFSGCGRNQTEAPSTTASLVPKIDPALATVTTQVAVEKPHKVIIVINELHFSESELTKAQAAEVISFQQKIRKVILALQEQLGVKTVFKDGYGAETIQRVAADQKYIREALQEPTYQALLLDKTQRLAAIATLTNAGGKAAETAKSLAKVGELYDLTSQEAIYGLVFEGKVKLMPAEDPKLIKESTHIAKTDDDAINNPAFIELQNKREVHVINQAVAQPELHQLLVFGQFHDFEAEVLAHNKANPSQQIMLIEITPIGQDKLFQELLKD